MTNQEIFDTVVIHLRNQGEKSQTDEPNQDGDFECLYRLKRGDKILKCAAGCLIKDEDYKPKFERKNAGWSEMAYCFADMDIKLILRLQNIHDLAEIPDWERQFQVAAKDYGLIYSPLTNEKSTV